MLKLLANIVSVNNMLYNYMRMKYGPKKPVEEVTEEEFLAALISSGESEEKAKQIVFFSKALGSDFCVGDKMLRIK